MSIALYHGSEKIIVQPIFGAGKEANDYGKAFYCTESLEMAKEWSVADGRDGFANKYIFNEEGLTIIDLYSEEYHILNWLTVLLENRRVSISTDLGGAALAYMLKEFRVPLEKADAVIGMRADDSYFSFARAFLQGTISLEKLSEALRLGDLGRQMAIKSEKAFTHLEYEGCVTADHKVYFPKKSMRDTLAREKFKEISPSPLLGTYIIDILREGWKNDDERLPRNIS